MFSSPMKWMEHAEQDIDEQQVSEDLQRVQQRVHKILFDGRIPSPSWSCPQALPWTSSPSGSSSSFSLRQMPVRGIPHPDRDREFDRDQRHDGERRRTRARGEQQNERLVRRSQKYREHRARADEAACRTALPPITRKPALRDDADRRSQKGREPAAQNVAVAADIRPVLQNFDEKIHQEQERKYFQAVNERIEQNFSHAVAPFYR